MERHDYLRRLPGEFYQGHSFVHWSMTMQDRATGWLNESLHLQFREWLTHALFLQRCSCAVYSLMPDHMHLLTVGLSVDSDQKRLLAYLRKQINIGLGRYEPAFSLQKQPYDHVLKEQEREQDAFQAVAHYIAENPVRADLVGRASQYPFTGGLVPGYPDLSFWEDDYWIRFWRTYAYLCKRHAGEEGR